MTDYSLLLAFDTDDAQFVRGFEAGRIWNELNQTDEQVVATVHAENAEMMLRIAEALNRSVQSEDLDERWITVMFGPYQGELA
jgi:hypothetical protein